jgi:hypothetical protein
VLLQLAISHRPELNIRTTHRSYIQEVQTQSIFCAREEKISGGYHTKNNPFRAPLSTPSFILKISLSIFILQLSVSPYYIIRCKFKSTQTTQI